MKSPKLVILLVMAITYSGELKPNIICDPEQRIYYSSNEKFYFEVIPAKKHILCKGTLYRKEEGKSLLLWSRNLENRIAPAQVIVANSGKFIVSFDDWYERGFGDNVVVIYSENGKLLYKFSLTAIFEENKLAELPLSSFLAYVHGIEKPTLMSKKIYLC